MILQKIQTEFEDVSSSYRNLDFISKGMIALGVISLIAGIIVALIGATNIDSYHSYEELLGQYQIAGGLMGIVSSFFFFLCGFIGLAVNDIRKHIVTNFNIKYDNPEEHIG